MVVLAAATGLRPSELFALEHRDVDREAGLVQIRRAYANGRVKQTKTRLSRRAVPLQASAVEALDQLPSRHDSSLLFPDSRGGYLDFRNFNRRRWKPVQKALGIDPLRDLYDLRHTYATFAQMSRVASAASFGTIRERLLPATSPSGRIKVDWGMPRHAPPDQARDREVAVNATMLQPIR